MQFLYQYQMYSPVLATLIYWCQTGSVNRIKRRATYQISQVSLAVNHRPKKHLMSLALCKIFSAMSYNLQNCMLLLHFAVLDGH